MSTIQEHKRFEIPESLQIQLSRLRRNLAQTKLSFAFLVCLSSFMGTSLLIFILDRFNETHLIVRTSLFAVLLVSATFIPIAAYRWHWKLRTNFRISKWLRLRNKSVGDRLMGAIELSESAGEQGRSPKLVEAALYQVAEKTSKVDLNTYVPNEHNRWAMRATTVLAVLIGLLIATFPAAMLNAMARLSFPWLDVPRYTFTAVEPVSPALTVPVGEPFEIAVTLKSTSIWTPLQGHAESKDLQDEMNVTTISSNRENDTFLFQFPSVSTEKEIEIGIGDYRQSIHVQPIHRPEIVKVEAHIQLPEYLQQSKSFFVEDIRRGSIDILQGARVSFHASVSETLDVGNLEQISPKSQLALKFENKLMTSDPFVMSDTNHQFQWTWRDKNGFDGKKPLQLVCNSIPDNPPVTFIQGLAAQQVLLNSEQINFSVLSTDDYGLKAVGLRCMTESSTALSNQNVDLKSDNVRPNESKTPERFQELKVGGPQSIQLDALATFRPLDFGIESGVVELSAWGMDYYPNRTPAISAAVTVLVLTPDQHSQWITNQLDQWQRSALEVRDRELQILDKNKSLLRSSDDSDSKFNLSQLLNDQSRDETSNAKRLESVAQTGENLLKLAAKNESIGVGHLEKWAEMQQILSDLSKKKMPKVAGLLKEAADAKDAKGPSLKTDESSKSVQDSSQKPIDPESPKGESSQPRISIPQTTVVGPSKVSNDPNDLRTVQNVQQQLTAEAIAAQEKLLADFEKLSEEMNTILGNLEASTFVKRLKAASRAQDELAESLRESLKVQYSSSLDPQNQASQGSSGLRDKLLSSSSQQAKDAGSDLANIVDDMDAFFERRRTDGLRMVLSDIRATKAVAAINRMVDDIAVEQGMSIAQSEFWADAMDRWAEELIDPATQGNSSGSKSSDSLPPSVVLDSLRLLEGQVSLREQTRVADQRSSHLNENERKQEGDRLAVLQGQLGDRASQVLSQISQLPNSIANFENEMKLFEQAGAWMAESANRLRMPDTGRAEIALQTEIIETLLKSKRINPKGGGGSSGGAPGGGGQGEAIDSALALLGIGTNVQEVRESREVEQSTGTSGNVLPQEYRKGLDEYFFKLEQNRSSLKGDE